MTQYDNPREIIIYSKHTQENPRINREDRQKFIFHAPAYPKETSPQHTVSTHTEEVHHLLGSFILVFNH